MPSRSVRLVVVGAVAAAGVGAVDRVVAVIVDAVRALRDVVLGARDGGRDAATSVTRSGEREGQSAELCASVNASQVRTPIEIACLEDASPDIGHDTSSFRSSPVLFVIGAALPLARAMRTRLLAAILLLRSALAAGCGERERTPALPPVRLELDAPDGPAQVDAGPWRSAAACARRRAGPGRRRRGLRARRRLQRRRGARRRRQRDRRPGRRAAPARPR